MQELERRMRKCNLLEDDIEEEFVRSSGVGGQKVNRSSTCVHLRHICSGLSVKVQKSRSQFGRVCSFAVHAGLVW